MFRTLLSTLFATLISALSLPSITIAEEISIRITNLTQGIYFTPLLISAHGSASDIFEPGAPASPQLQQLAEGGDISGLANALNIISVVVEDPAAGLLAPGQSTEITDMNTESYDRLSIVGMMLPTNDGFVGLDSWEIPNTAGSYVVYLNAYDAGTEANDERIVTDSGAPGVLGIPTDPGAASGTGGTGIAPSSANTNVHIHPGNIGDDNPSGGASDLDNSVHRWLNPVAKVVITVN